MKLKRFLLPILAWSGLMITSCHCEHEEFTGHLSSLQVGNVVCSDGNILSMDKFKQSDKEAVAIVFHINRSAETDNLGYAVYIHDMEPLAFADSLGIDQGTSASLVSIRPTTGIKPLYTTIATVTMNLIVSAAIVLLNPYVTVYISYKIPPFALSVHIPDVSTSIYVEVDSKVLLGLPFCDKASGRLHHSGTPLGLHRVPYR